MLLPVKHRSSTLQARLSQVGAEGAKWAVGKGGCVVSTLASQEGTPVACRILTLFAGLTWRDWEGRAGKARGRAF